MSDDDGLCSQYRKPEGEDGRTVLEGMNRHHAPLWDWCMRFMPRYMDGAVLDIGCGGGMFLHRLYERYPFAMLNGVDISEEAVRMSSEVNADAVAEGSMRVGVGSVMELPYDDASFYLVTAIETYFFWPDLEAGINEAARVTSPGGMMIIGSEMQVEDDDDYVKEAWEKYGARLRPDDIILSMMDRAGFEMNSYRSDDGSVAFVGVKRFG